MKFGLFGGAVANKSADTADSKGYDGFVDLIPSIYPSTNKD